MMGATLAALCFAAAQGFLYLGAPGNRLAVATLRLAARCNPKHHRARAWLGYLAALRVMRAGDADAAVKLLREASREAPSETPIRANLGIALTMAGQHQEAIHYLRGVIRESEDLRRDSQSWRALAWCQLRTGQTAAAAQTLEQAQDAGAHSRELDVIGELSRLVTMGSAKASGEPDAGARLTGLLRARPRMVGLALELAEQEAAANRLPVTRRIVEALPDELRVDSLRLMAGSRLNAGDLDTAQVLADLLSHTEGGAADADLVRSELAVAREKYDRAVDHALRAAEADPNNARALHQLGLSLLYAGQTEDSGRQFAAAMAAGSGSALAGGVVALLLLDQGKVTDARKVFVRERSGDALGCAFAHTAQALLLAEAADWREFERLATWAEQSWTELPEATRNSPVVALLQPARERVAQLRAEHGRDGVR